MTSPTALAALKAKIEATPTITLPLSATLQTMFVATWEWPGSSVSAPVVCYKCQKPGHYAASCLPCSGCKGQMASADTLKKHEALCPQVSRPAPTRQNREGLTTTTSSAARMMFSLLWGTLQRRLDASSAWICRTPSVRFTRQTGCHRRRSLLSKRWVSRSWR